MATIDEQDREALMRLLWSDDFPNIPYDAVESTSLSRAWYVAKADRILAAGWRPPEAPPKREWPVTEEAVRAYLDSQPIRPGLSNAARHLWRARVEGMTQEELIRFLYELPDANEIEAVDIRAALLALGDL